MNELAEIIATGGGGHHFSFRLLDENGELKRTQIFSDLSLSMRAATDPNPKPIGETTVFINGSASTLPVTEYRFGNLEGTDDMFRLLKGVIEANRIGATLEEPRMQCIVGSPLGAVAAYASGFGPGEDILPYGWPLGFRNVFDLSGDVPRITDRFATAVMIPKPNPQERPGNAYQTSLPKKPTTLLNAMKDEAIVDGKLVPRAPNPLSLRLTTTEIGKTASGVLFVEAQIVGVNGLRRILSLPENTSLLVYSEVYRLAKFLNLPPKLLRRMFIGDNTERGTHGSQLQSFQGLSKIHPSNLRQACRIGF